MSAALSVRAGRRWPARRRRPFAGEIPPAERRSGYEFMSRETRAMQDDDTANPGMLWVLDGEALWSRKAGAAGRACADCHGEPDSMKGVAARYPAFDAARAGRSTSSSASTAAASSGSRRRRSPGRARSCSR